MGIAHSIVEERKRGLQYAREWRIKNKPKFDALFGPERCRHCGQLVAH